MLNNKMSKKNKLAFYCFSPPVMIATFLVEMALVFYTLFFRKLNLSVRLGAILILCLAIFQLAEYGICENLGLDNSTWAKIGFTSITLLPPLGVHLIYSIANKRAGPLVLASYAGAVAWILAFLFGDIMTGAVCGGNYVIFRISEPFEGLYYIYYDSLLLATMGLSAIFARKVKTKKLRNALYTLVFGYGAFIIPSIMFSTFDKYGGVDSNLPSVMCGFAVILALFLGMKILPSASKARSK